MDENKEKRLVKRFVQHAQLEIRVLCRSGSSRQGDLIDCSEAGIGLFSREAIKKRQVILLRVCETPPSHISTWPKEAGQFHMIAANVRWCQESISTDGEPGFRIGLMRLQPFHG